MAAARASALAGGLLWAVLHVGRWAETRFAHPAAEWLLDTALTTAEESAKSALREAFAAVARAVDGCTAWVLSLFVDRRYWRARRALAGSRRAAAWSDYWREGRPSTLNAVLARAAAAGAVADASRSTPASPTADSPSPAPGAAPPLAGPPPRTWAGRTVSRAARAAAAAVAAAGAAVSSGTGAPTPRALPPVSSSSSLRRNGSDLFDRAALTAGGPRRTGLLEDARRGLDLGLARGAAAVRAGVRRLLFMPPPPAPIDEGLPAHPAPRPAPPAWEEAASMPRRARFRRASSLTACDLLADVSSAGEAIVAEGYPLEEHTVTTSDGYVLTLTRIPRRAARGATLFVHGILDTPLGWVGNGVTSSHAFAAADAGLDVWLASSRANPPFAHIDADRAPGGLRYWKYTVNEMGLEDVAAQVDHIHVVKCAELAAAAAGAGRGGDDGDGPSSSSPPPASPRRPGAAALEAGFARVAAADAALASRRLRACASETDLAAADGDAARATAAAATPPNEAELRAAAAAGRGVRAARPGTPLPRELPAGAPPPPLRHASEPPAPPPYAPVPTLTRAGRRPPRPAPPTPPARSRSPAAVGSRAAATRARRRAPADPHPPQPYRLTCVGHSMGGAALLIYAVMCRHLGRPHHISSLVLLSPAGFQERPMAMARPFIYLVPVWTWLLDHVVARWRPGAGLRFAVPSSPLRHVAFKLTHDLRHLPAVQELVRAFFRAATSGDASQWDRALQLPHYSAASMPCLSVHMGNHLCQWIRTGKFQLYDYGGGGGPGSNLSRYGTRAPPDVAAMYGLLDDVRVDIVGGRADGVVAVANCETHVRAMAEQGVDVRCEKRGGE